MKKILFSIYFLSLYYIVSAQNFTMLHAGNKISLRGLCVVSDSVIWASGNNGTVAKSVDGGKTFVWLKVSGFEKTDFRDIEAFSDSTAIIMGIDSPAYILKTTDAGVTWKTVYKNNKSGMFLDAIDFFKAKNGIVVGDPINDKFFIATTKNHGDSWDEISFNKSPKAEKGEACFASSGTNIRLVSADKYILVSGGLRANLFNKTKIQLPILQGKESTGANSVAYKNNKIFLVVGGDFNKKDSITNNCFITFNGGKTWTAPVVPPNGYRSCVEFVKNNTWVTCGLNGVDITENNAKTFKIISTESFNVCIKSPSNKYVFLAGSNGKLAKISL